MDKIIRFIGGMDKAAHFGIGGVICACVAIACFLHEGVLVFANAMLGCAAGTVIAGLLALLKEACIDDVADGQDVLASVCGCVPVYLAFIVGFLIA